jgi:hypothetical protein
MRRLEAPPGFVAEPSDGGGAITLVRSDFAGAARARGLFERDGIARAFAGGVPLGGGRHAAAVIDLGPAEIVVRKLRHGGLLGPLLGESYWGPSRVLRELGVTRELAAAGAPVPAPAFALARRRAGPLWECAIGTLRVPGIPLLAAQVAAAERGENGEARAAMMRACAAAVRAFHERGGRHADLNASNVLVAWDAVASNADSVRAFLVDLDCARVAPGVPSARRAREIARLWRSLAKHAGAASLTAPERDAFVAAYCAGDAALERELRDALRRERLRTALHAWRYPHAQ